MVVLAAGTRNAAVVCAREQGAGRAKPGGGTRGGRASEEEWQLAGIEERAAWWREPLPPSGRRPTSEFAFEVLAAPRTESGWAAERGRVRRVAQVQ